MSPKGLKHLTPKPPRGKCGQCRKIILQLIGNLKKESEKYAVRNKKVERFKMKNTLETIGYITVYTLEAIGFIYLLYRRYKNKKDSDNTHGTKRWK